MVAVWNARRLRPQITPALLITPVASPLIGDEYGKHLPNANGRRDIAGKAKLCGGPGFLHARRVKRAGVQRSVKPQIALVVGEIGIRNKQKNEQRRSYDGKILEYRHRYTRLSLA